MATPLSPIDDDKEESNQAQPNLSLGSPRSASDASENTLGSPRPTPGVCSFSDLTISKNSNETEDPDSPLNTTIARKASKAVNVEDENAVVPTLKSALETLLAQKPGCEEAISNACNLVERAMYGGETTEHSLVQLEPVLVKVLMRHVSSTDAHLTLLEVLRKLCSIGPLKNHQLLQSIMRVLRASKHDASHKLGALGALGALCLSHSEHRKRLLSDSENIRAIARIMRSFEQLPSAQAAGLCSLFDRNPALSSKHAVAIVNAGAARITLRILRIHSRRAGLVETALLAIAQVCSSATPTARIALRDAGAARAAVDALVVHERNGSIALASVSVLRALGSIACQGVPPGVIPRAVLSAMCTFRSERNMHIEGLAVLREIAEASEGAKQVAGAGAAQVVLTTMIEYRTEAAMQLSCVELLCQLVAFAGKENLECNCDDIPKTVSGSVRLYLHDTQLMESTAKLLKLLRTKTE